MRYRFSRVHKANGHHDNADSTILPFGFLSRDRNVEINLIHTPPGTCAASGFFPSQPAFALHPGILQPAWSPAYPNRPTKSSAHRWAREQCLGSRRSLRQIPHLEQKHNFLAYA